MRTRSVLIVEDEDLQRRILRRQLEWSGFEVVAAGTATEARNAVEKRGEPFDVIALDMNLEKDHVTGAELGKEFCERAEWKLWPAEFLINSAHSDEDYYQQALKLEVAAYLKKGKADNLDTLVDHVRVLALRRALSIARPDMLQRIQSIVKGSRDRREAIRRFCEEVVCAELREILPLDYLLLLTDPEKTYGFSNREGLPRGEHSVYETVQALTHGKAGRTEPFELKTDLLEAVRTTDTRNLDPLFNLLDRAALVPISADPALKLSLGLLPASQGGRDVEEARRLAQLLVDYLRSALLRCLLELGSLADSELAAKRQAVLRATAKFCLYVGQDQLTALNAAIDLSEIQEPGFYVRRLRTLASDLIASGELLGELVRGPGADSEAEMDKLAMGEVISSAWSEVSRSLTADEQKMLHLTGDCQVKGRRDYLHLAIGRVLQWFVQRRFEVPHGVEPVLTAHCDASADGPRIIFEDRSPRLPKRLRDQLLEPFASATLNPPAGDDLEGPGQHLALYLAKALVEEGCGGLLLDQTDQLAGETGHRIMMHLPGIGHAVST